MKFRAKSNARWIIPDFLVLWRRWLARRPVTAEVAGSSPVGIAEHHGKNTSMVGICAVLVTG